MLREQDVVLPGNEALMRCHAFDDNACGTAKGVHMSEEICGPNEVGPLHGTRVMLTGVAFAGPYAARWLGDMGAEIIKIEIPGAGDSSRVGRRVEGGVVPKWISLGRNMKSLEFNMNFDKFPGAKDVFVDLVKSCDIWINSVPGIGKHGASDELALEANPKLVIVHVTGYGLAQNGGSERYLGKPCFDPVAQAFSGLAVMQGMPDGPYLTANPLVVDITTAGAAVTGALAALVNARGTGQGQVVDVSLYESAAYLMNYQWCSQLNGEGLYQRSGPLNEMWRPFGYYECGDGKWVAVGVWGPGIWRKFCTLMGVTEENFPYMATCGQEDPQKVEEMDRIWLAWLAARTAAEVDDAFMAAGIPVSALNDANDAFAHEHWRSRGNFVELTDATTGRTFHDFGTSPKFTRTPYTPRTGGPLLGEHTDHVLGDLLGYSSTRVEELKASGVVAASLTTK